MQDFILTYLNPETLELDSNGIFGVDDVRFFGKHFIPFALEDGQVNPNFLDLVSKFESFRCDCIQGSASFRCENRQLKKGSKQYWYGYKKIGGKVRRFNIGDLNNFTFELVENAIAVLCGLQEVAQKKSATSCEAIAAKDQPLQPLIELAGHGKCDHHIQPSLVEIINDPLNIAIAKSNRLERENKDLNKSLIDALDKIKKLETSLKASEYRRQDLSQDCEDIKCQLTAQSDKYRNYGLAVAITNERNQELEKRVKELGYLVNSTQKVLNVRDKELATCQKALLSRIDSNQELEKNIFKLEQDYKTGEQEAFDNLDRFCSIVSIIDKYRALADGKTRQAHPRFNKLLDFIADIDKLC